MLCHCTYDLQGHAPSTSCPKRGYENAPSLQVQVSDPAAKEPAPGLWLRPRGALPRLQGVTHAAWIMGL
jgi:hypothetical protein